MGVLTSRLRRLGDVARPPINMNGFVVSVKSPSNIPSKPSMTSWRKVNTAERGGGEQVNINSGHYLLSANLKHKCSLHKTLGPIMVARHKNGGPLSWVCACLTLPSASHC